MNPPEQGEWVFWGSFVYRRRYRYDTEADLCEEVEFAPGSMELSLFGVERKVGGRPLNPLSYMPDVIQPPLLLDLEELRLLEQAGVRVLWE